MNEGEPKTPEATSQSNASPGSPEEEQNFEEYLESLIHELSQQGEQYTEAVNKLRELKNSHQYLIRFISRHELEAIFEQGQIEPKREFIITDPDTKIEEVAGTRMGSRTDWDRSFTLRGAVQELEGLLGSHGEKAREAREEIFKRKGDTNSYFGSGYCPDWHYLAESLEGEFFPQSLQYLPEAIRENRYDNFVHLNQEMAIKTIEGAVDELGVPHVISKDQLVRDGEVVFSPGSPSGLEDYFKRQLEGYFGHYNLQAAKKGKGEMEGYMLYLKEVGQEVNEGKVEECRQILEKLGEISQRKEFRITESLFCDHLSIDRRMQRIVESAHLTERSDAALEALRDFFADEDFFEDPENIERFVNTLEEMYSSSLDGDMGRSQGGQYEYVVYVDGEDVVLADHVRDDWKSSEEPVPIDNILAISSIMPLQQRVKRTIKDLGERADRVPFFDEQNTLIHPKAGKALA